MFDLFLAHHLRKGNRLSRIQFRALYIRFLNDVFVEERAAVGYTFTLGIAYPMRFSDKQNVFPDICPSYFLYLIIPVVLEQQPHFHAVIPDGSLPIVTYDKGFL